MLWSFFNSNAVFSIPGPPPSLDLYSHAPAHFVLLQTQSFHLDLDHLTRGYSLASPSSWDWMDWQASLRLSINKLRLLLVAMSDPEFCRLCCSIDNFYGCRVNVQTMSALAREGCISLGMPRPSFHCNYNLALSVRSIGKCL